MTQWKLRRHGRMVGPLPTSELLRALQLGKVPIDSEAQRVGDTQWEPLAKFPEFAEEIARDTPTHIMSSPWFLESPHQRDQAKAPDTDPTDVLSEPTPLPAPSVLRGPWPIPPLPGAGLDSRSAMATIPDPSLASNAGAEAGRPSGAPSFALSDVEPITPRVSHQVVPAAAVPPASEISPHRPRPSVRAEPPRAALPGDTAQQGPLSAGAPVCFDSAPHGAGAALSPPTEDAVLRSLLSDASAPPSARFNTARSALGGAASPLNAMLAGLGQHAPDTSQHPLTRSTRVEPGPPMELTPLSGTPIVSRSQAADAGALDLADIQAPEPNPHDLQDAVVDGDVESAPHIVPHPDILPLGPEGMNRVESHGPAPIPQAERRSAILQQETTSPAIRSSRSAPPGGGRTALWVLILVLAFALLIATVAILAR